MGACFFQVTLFIAIRIVRARAKAFVFRLAKVSGNHAWMKQRGHSECGTPSDSYPPPCASTATCSPIFPTNRQRRRRRCHFGRSHEGCTLSVMGASILLHLGRQEGAVSGPISQRIISPHLQDKSLLRFVPWYSSAPDSENTELTISPLIPSLFVLPEHN